jgi:hypothetical protein
MRVIPGHPALLPLIVVKDLSTALEQFVGLGNVSAGVGIYGEAAAYALVWELGSRRLKRPGPKTLWSVNREGERAILTKQAPFGYVTPTDEFWPIIEEEIAHIDWGEADNNKEMVMLIEIALDNASQRIAKIIAGRAPVDSGALRAGIMGVDTDETDFLNMDEDSDLEAGGTLIL